MQQVWRKRWRNTAWFALAGLTLVLLISAVYKKNHNACQGVEVSFKGDGNNFFIEEKGVVALLKANGLVIGQPIENIDLKALEESLKKDKWIANAELFFDKNQLLQVKVEEKTPVARIFTVEGSSFYIDSACRKLPLSEKLSARIPMFTNFPADVPKLSKPDSELLASAKNLAMFIQADDFWKAQVAQVDITPEGFEMIPTVGDHVIVLGDGDDLQEKFDRLFSFYKQVWTKVGFEKYEKVDVRFKGQVVATLTGTKPATVDSAKAKKTYEKLIEETRNAEIDSSKTAFVTNQQGDKTEAKSRATLKNESGSKRLMRSKEVVVKKERIKRTFSKRSAPKRRSPGRRVPKAVMRKR